MTSLETDGRTAGISHALLTCHHPFQAIRRIDMQPRFGGKYLHSAAAPSIVHPSRGFVQTGRETDGPAVIIPPSYLQLRIIVIDALPNTARAAEVESRPRDRQVTACHAFPVVVGRNGVRLHLHPLRLYGAVWTAREIEERMVRQVEHRRAVGHCLIADRQFVSIGEVSRTSSRPGKPFSPSGDT